MKSEAMKSEAMKNKKLKTTDEFMDFDVDKLDKSFIMLICGFRGTDKYMMASNIMYKMIDTHSGLFISSNDTDMLTTVLTTRSNKESIRKRPLLLAIDLIGRQNTELMNRLTIMSKNLNIAVIVISESLSYVAPLMRSNLDYVACFNMSQSSIMHISREYMAYLELGYKEGMKHLNSVVTQDTAFVISCFRPRDGDDVYKSSYKYNVRRYDGLHTEH